MANVIAVKGINRIIDNLNDEVSAMLKKNPSANIEAGFELTGQYAFDKDGHLALVGKVAITAPTDALAGELSALPGNEYTSQGSGTVKVWYRIHSYGGVSMPPPTL